MKFYSPVTSKSTVHARKDIVWIAIKRNITRWIKNKKLQIDFEVYLKLFPKLFQIRSTEFQLSVFSKMPILILRKFKFLRKPFKNAFILQTCHQLHDI